MSTEIRGNTGYQLTSGNLGLPVVQVRLSAELGMGRGLEAGGKVLYSCGGCVPGSSMRKAVWPAGRTDGYCFYSVTNLYSCDFL